MRETPRGRTDLVAELETTIRHSTSVVIPDSDLARLFHQLNNQLGVILANAELLEKRVAEETHRARAGQVVVSVLNAIAIIQQIRQLADPSTAGQ
jgi:hypothetical protein